MFSARMRGDAVVPVGLVSVVAANFKQPSFHCGWHSHYHCRIGWFGRINYTGDAGVI